MITLPDSNNPHGSQAGGSIEGHCSYILESENLEGMPQYTINEPYKHARDIGTSSQVINWVGISYGYKLVYENLPYVSNNKIGQQDKFHTSTIHRNSYSEWAHITIDLVNSFPDSKCHTAIIIFVETCDQES